MLVNKVIDAIVLNVTLHDQVGYSGRHQQMLVRHGRFG